MAPTKQIYIVLYCCNIAQCDGNCTSDVQRRRRRTAEGSSIVVEQASSRESPSLGKVRGDPLATDQSQPASHRYLAFYHLAPRTLPLPVISKQVYSENAFFSSVTYFNYYVTTFVYLLSNSGVWQYNAGFQAWRLSTCKL